MTLTVQGIIYDLPYQKQSWELLKVNCTGNNLNYLLGIIKAGMRGVDWFCTKGEFSLVCLCILKLKLVQSLWICFTPLTPKLLQFLFVLMVNPLNFLRVFLYCISTVYPNIQNIQISTVYPQNIQILWYFRFLPLVRAVPSLSPWLLHTLSSLLSPSNTNFCCGHSLSKFPVLLHFLLCSGPLKWGGKTELTMSPSL